MSKITKRNKTRKKRITIEEVANTLGLSKATVSLALNGNPLVARATRIKVVETAERLGYHPNYFARRLSSGTSEVIGLYILRGTEQFSSCNWTLPSSWMFYNPILKGVMSHLLDNDYRLQLEVITFEQAGSALIREIIQEGFLDGLLLLMQDDGDYDCLQLAKEEHFPLVTVNARVSENIASVKINNEKGIQKVVEHLLQIGHERIAYIGGPRNDFNAMERETGFLSALKKAGMSLNPHYLTRGDWQLESGRLLCSGLLDLSSVPTAIVCANDHMAIGAIQKAAERGIAVPGSLSVVGFDNTELCEIIIPRLSTVEQPLEEMGMVAAQEVLRQLEEGTEDVQHTNLDTTLILRGSC